ncbi:MAG: putative toxin-antitoxin system toxin component, PIN family [Gammaproteobacteria bacterium]|nr:putative toxin-antitoxin system toxin component, PIN family [Gammaproteobacteria bacterium]
MRVVIDTNVLVSGLISRSSPPAQIVNAVLRGDIIPVMSHASFAELEEVLHRPRLQSYFRNARITPFQLLTALKTIAEFPKPGHSKQRMRDPTDRIFVELAASHPTPDFLVTGDKDFEQDYYHGVPVISASLFVKTILRSK